MSTTAASNQNIRILILSILYAQRSEGTAEIGGWLDRLVLRRLLANEGYALSLSEIDLQLDYLEDTDIRCVERKRVGDVFEGKHKVKLTAKGIRAATGEEKIIGIGIGRAE